MIFRLFIPECQAALVEAGGNKIERSSDYYDNAAILVQLGLIPPPPAVQPPRSWRLDGLDSRPSSDSAALKPYCRSDKSACPPVNKV